MDSSNSECERQWRKQQLPWLIVAEQQTQGRGRYGRQWQSSNKTNIYLSFIMENHFLREVGYLNLFCGMQIYNAIQELHGNFCERLTLKWPNDLYIGDKKLAGILLQALDPELRYVIVGLGINIYANTADIPEIATSLALESITDLTNQARLDLIIRLMQGFSTENIKRYAHHPQQVLDKFWQYAKRTRNFPYTYSCSHYKHSGILKGIHKDATIDLQLTSGENIHLRS